jgi:DNA-binding NtrC family response regulator
MVRGFIMVLDDDKDTTSVLAASLRRQGLHVHAFTDPVVALQDFKQNFKDCILVISDIRMPQINGFQFVRMARELRPDLKVIFMTAFEINISEFEKIHPSMKVHGLVKKPILMRKLEVLINNSIRKNEERDGSQVLRKDLPIDLGGG